MYNPPLTFNLPVRHCGKYVTNGDCGGGMAGWFDQQEAFHKFLNYFFLSKITDTQNK